MGAQLSPLTILVYKMSLTVMEELTTFPLVIFPVSVLVASCVTLVGHQRFFSNVIVGAVLFGFFSVFLVLEILFFVLTPLRSLWSREQTRLTPSEATLQASGKRDVSLRKIVLFDGVCVLCNRAGQFVVAHLPDPNLVSFVPFQDAISNPHVSTASIRKEFPDFQDGRIQEEICVISGDRILWGPDAVMEVCSWMHYPFPIIKFGFIIPRPIRNFFYNIVSKSRYEWFGTQPLEQNFSKSLCPYLQVKKFLEKSE